MAGHRLCTFLVVLGALLFARRADADDAPAAAGSNSIVRPAGETLPPSAPPETPAPTNATPGAAEAEKVSSMPGQPEAPGAIEADGQAAGAGFVVVPAADLGEEVAPERPSNLSYGVAARLRWVTVPSWMLNAFTKRNVPLSSWGTGIEIFRRKGNFEFVAAFSYQNMSPSDGNWLGRNHSAATDTNFVQFQHLAIYGIDASFIWHSFINNWFGIHYGAGFGLGIVGGHLALTKDDNGQCTDANLSDLTQCHPANVTCTAGTCDGAQLDAAGRSISGDVPPVIPIINILVGVDFRVPRARGWEARIEGGFYDAFYLGGGVGYSF